MSPRWGMPAEVAAALLQVLAVVAGGPLLVGMVRTVRCRLEGRSGPPVRQPLRDLRKLAVRQRRRPADASWVFAAAPLVLVATSLVIAAAVPLAATDPASRSGADLFVVVYLLLVGSVGMALAGLDTGTAFGGMGASRAMTIGAVAEPALLVSIVALSIPVGSSNLGVIVSRSLAHPVWLASPQRLLALGAFLIVVLAEAGRLPVDNPATHLELTMVHEATVLEYAGADLAVVVLGTGMRFAILLGLLANLFFPWGIATSGTPLGLAVGLGSLVAKVAVLGAGIAGFEVVMAKLRLFRVPELLAGAFVLAVLAVVTALVVP